MILGAYTLESPPLWLQTQLNPSVLGAYAPDYALTPVVAHTTEKPLVKRWKNCRKKYYQAVENALALPWSNGPVEGNVNRLKTIKRQMYGRAGFDLLKNVSYKPIRDHQKWGRQDNQRRRELSQTGS